MLLIRRYKPQSFTLAIVASEDKHSYILPEAQSTLFLLDCAQSLRSPAFAKLRENFPILKYLPGKDFQLRVAPGDSFAIPKPKNHSRGFRKGYETILNTVENRTQQ